MLKCGIVGCGVVGMATIKNIAHKTEVYIYDPEKGYFGDVKDCDIVFVCINEKNPSMKNLDGLVGKLVLENQEGFFVIRTTVMPGTIDSLSYKYNREFVFMPEFLREWNADYDAEHPDKVVIGTGNRKIYKTLKTLFEQKNTIRVKPIEAELAKIALNSIATIKVVFAEELFDLAEKLKADYNNIYKIFELDQNVNERHLLAGKDGYRGAGGKCLSKDSGFMIKTGKKHNSRMSLLETAVILNKLFLMRLKQW